jgi:predicted XRE-type DNA-binding protein
MRNDKRKIGNAMGNKDFRIIINKMKAKEALFDNIRKFMTQNKVAQNKVAQNKVAQNKVAQNKVAQNKMTQNKMTHNSRSKKNRRSTVV